MPIGERIIQPVHIGRSLEIQSPNHNAHRTCASNTLVGVLYQLASLVRHADDIFCDLSEECQKVFDRSERIRKKLLKVEEWTIKLDAKLVQIPVGDLSKFSKCDDHHTAKHGFDCDIFTLESRPQCIKDQYSLSDRTPSHILRGADLYRKDGLCSSRLFRLWPIVLNEHKVSTPDLNLPRRMQSVASFQKRYKKLKDCQRTVRSTDDLLGIEKHDKSKEDNENKENLDSEIYPAEVIPIDTSGTGFHRMQSFRKALANIEYEDVKKKKRRRTISGVPDNIMHEIEMFEKKRKSISGKEQIREYSFDDLDTGKRDEEMAKYLDEIDAKMEERKEDEKIMREPKIMKFLPCRRTKSLPRCAKLSSSKYAIDRKSVGGESSLYDGSNLSLASMGSISSRLSRSTKRSSIISNKIRSLVRSSSGSRLEKHKYKARPKSLDLDAIDFDQDTSNRTNLAKMPSMPDGVLRSPDSDGIKTNIGPGSYYNFEGESNTLPRRNVRKLEYPWDGLPKDWTTSVKLREISKRRSTCTDRQSSSGHWSGTNSNRHSLDSDNIRSENKSTSQYSLGQDSGRDSPLPTESRCGTDTTGGYAGDDASTLAGDVDSVPEAKLDTESWLKNLAVRAASRDEVSSSSAETITSLTRLTKKNIMALDLMMSSPRKRRPLFDDGESDYSVDQEGFYTSFHNDSGLRKSNGNLADEDDLSPSKDSQSFASVCSVESVIHNPDGEKYAGIKKGNSNNNVLNKVTPPTPPLRTSSNPNNLSNSDEKIDGKNKNSNSVGRQDSSSMSDTDPETMTKRLESKTHISNTSIPSLVPVLSDDDSSFGHLTSGEGDGSSPEEKYRFDKNQCSVVDMNQNLDKTGITTDDSVITSLDGSITSYHKIEDLDDCEDYAYKTLPKAFYSKCGDHHLSQTNTYSWPRSQSKKSGDHLTKSGILKNTDGSLGGPKPPKSLNFSPVVNMFNPDTPQAIQMPLPSSPSSSEDGKREATGKTLFQVADADSYKLTVPFVDEDVTAKIDDVPMKYQPTIVVKPGSRATERKGSHAKLTPVKDPKVPTINKKPAHYATSPIGTSINQNVSGISSPYAVSSLKGVKQSPYQKPEMDQTGVSHSGYFSMQGINSNGNTFGSINSLESSESLTWSNSLTYVTMASPCSSPNLSNLDVPVLNTPTGSFESLNDQSKTLDSTYDLSRVKPCSKTIDESNLSSTMETIAITTNSSMSFHSVDTAGANKSFSTFSGSVSAPLSTSTPFSSSSSSRLKERSSPQENRKQVTLTHSVLHPQPHYSKSSSPTVVTKNHNRPMNKQDYKVSSNSPNQQPKRISSSQSFPQDMVKYAKSLVPERTSKYKVSKKSKSKSKEGPVNVNYTDTNSDMSTRTDSYRVAMDNQDNSRSSSYRVAMRESISCPSFQQQQKRNSVHVMGNNSVSSSGFSHIKRHPYSVTNTAVPEDFNRTDSYRVAVRNSLGVVTGDISTRNSSYRVAVDKMEPIIPDSRLEGLAGGNSSTQLMSGRDSRRMGITNVDQLKDVSLETRAKQSSPNLNTNKIDLSKIDTSTVKRRRPKSEVDPISVISSRDANKSNSSSSKSNKRHSTSSTYIKFDPIFEDREDMMTSMESLKTDSSHGTLKMSNSVPETGYGFNKSQPKINSTNYGKLMNEKSNSSLLGTLKSTIKSISSNTKQSKDIQLEDDWRFSMV